MTGAGDVLLIFGVLIGWLLIQWVVLPRLGVPT
jgi:hypothetical protein